MEIEVERWGVIEEKKFHTTYATKEEALDHIRVRLGNDFKGYIVRLTGKYERE